jgi:hypothetical protein
MGIGLGEAGERGRREGWKNDWNGKWHIQWKHMKWNGRGRRKAAADWVSVFRQ